MKLYPYQQNALDALLEGESQYDRQCAILPTGAGKTVIFSKLIEQKLPGRTLVLAHREELLDQASDTIWDSIRMETGREQGTRSADLNDAVVVASVQSLVKRLHRYPRNHFGTIIVDECHHALADTWQECLNYWTGAKIHGFSATPHKGNDRRLIGNYFENIAYEVALRWLIEHGYLCPVICKSFPAQVNLKGLDTSGGEFRQQDVADRLEPLLRDIAEQLKQHMEGRKFVVFTHLVQTARRFSRMLRDIGVDADWVDGDNPNRKSILKDFGKKKGGVMCNSMLLTEGWNCPSVNGILNLRPCRSSGLYIQCAGRGLRTHPGKENLLILDPLYLHERHSMATAASLVAEDDEVATIMNRRAREAGDEIDLLELDSDATEELNAKLAAELRSKRQRETKTVDPTLIAHELGDYKVGRYQPTLPWHRKPITEPQRSALKSAKIDIDSVQDRGHASELLGMLKNRREKGLATAPQVMTLARSNYRYPRKPREATFEEANRFIGQKHAQWAELRKRRAA